MTATAAGERAHIPALDGVRGTAMLMVFVGHVALFGSTAAEKLNPIVKLLAANNGLGVDLFFALSGFLITGILYDSRGRTKYFRSFYIRRTLRIFPLYYSALLIVALAKLAFPNLFALQQVTHAATIANWTYTTNILIALRGWGAEPAFLAHFWSLAVEEQFYLLWPIAVIALRRESLLKLAIACIVIAPVLRFILLINSGFESAYTLLPARMDALLIGAAIALMFRDSAGLPAFVATRKAIVLGFAAVGTAVVLSVILRTGVVGSVLTAVRFSMSSLGFGLLLAGIVTGKESWLKNVFATPVLRFFGKYSYAMYVFHISIIIALPKLLEVTSMRLTGIAQRPPLVVFGLTALALTLGAALVSWTVLEKPCLDLKERITSRPSQLLQQKAA